MHYCIDKDRGEVLAGKKVLILVNHEIVIYNFRKEFVLELLKEGHEVSLSSPSGDKIKELTRLGCVHIETEIDRRGLNPLKDLKLLSDYLKMIRDIEPDIIYSYTIKPNVYGGLVARAMNIPFVATITGLGSAIQNDNFLKKVIMNLYKTSFKKAQTIFFQNTVNMDFFRKNSIVTKNQMKLVAGSGVNLNHFRYQKYPYNNDEINFIYIGRLMKEKGTYELLEAAEYFKGKTKNIKFHILGFFEEELEEKVNKLIEKNVIIYHGQQSDIRPFIDESHAIIHPSYHEGLSNVLLEAAASGRPILASDIPGCRETFDEGITGFGFEPKSTESLIKTIEKFIDLPYEQKEQMGILGRKKIEKEFNREKVVDTYILEIDNLKLRI